jgi:putative hydrolase of the HAD superfamily
MPIRAVVFDLFDTLVDLLTEEIPFEEHDGRRIPAFVMRLHRLIGEVAKVDLLEFMQVNRDVDAELRESRHSKHIETPSQLRFARVIERLGIDDASLPQRMVETHMAGVRAQVRELDHHPEVLSELARNVRIGLCSNFTHAPTAVAVLESAGLHEHMHAVVVSEAVGIRKPRSEIFEAVLGELDVAPEETLHVGDSLSADVGGAAALGIRTAWITRRVRDPGEKLHAFAGAPPDWCIADLAELPDLLLRSDAEQ